MPGEAPENEWPDFYPDDCPPSDANDLDGVVYRLVKSNPPTEADARSHLELGASPKAPPCQRSGLSCALDREYLEDVRRAVPYRRKNRIARGEFHSEHGKIKQTGPDRGHHTMWLRAPFLAKLPEMLRVV